MLSDSESSVSSSSSEIIISHNSNSRPLVFQYPPQRIINTQLIPVSTLKSYSHVPSLKPVPDISVDAKGQDNENETFPKIPKPMFMLTPQPFAPHQVLIPEGSPEGSPYPANNEAQRPNFPFALSFQDEHQKDLGKADAVNSGMSNLIPPIPNYRLQLDNENRSPEFKVPIPNEVKHSVSPPISIPVPPSVNPPDPSYVNNPVLPPALIPVLPRISIPTPPPLINPVPSAIIPVSSSANSSDLPPENIPIIAPANIPVPPIPSVSSMGSFPRFSTNEGWPNAPPIFPSEKSARLTDPIGTVPKIPLPPIYQESQDMKLDIKPVSEPKVPQIPIPIPMYPIQTAPPKMPESIITTNINPPDIPKISFSQDLSSPGTVKPSDANLFIPPIPGQSHLISAETESSEFKGKTPAVPQIPRVPNISVPPQNNFPVPPIPQPTIFMPGTNPRIPQFPVSENKILNPSIPSPSANIQFPLPPVLEKRPEVPPLPVPQTSSISPPNLAIPERASAAPPPAIPVFPLPRFPIPQQNPAPLPPSMPVSSKIEVPRPTPLVPNHEILPNTSSSPSEIKIKVPPIPLPPPIINPPTFRQNGSSSAVFSETGLSQSPVIEIKPDMPPHPNKGIPNIPKLNLPDALKAKIEYVPKVQESLSSSNRSSLEIIYIEEPRKDKQPIPEYKPNPAVYTSESRSWPNQSAIRLDIEKLLNILNSLEYNRSCIEKCLKTKVSDTKRISQLKDGTHNKEYCRDFLKSLKENIPDITIAHNYTINPIDLNIFAMIINSNNHSIYNFIVSKGYAELYRLCRDVSQRTHVLIDTFKQNSAILENSSIISYYVSFVAGFIVKNIENYSGNPKYFIEISYVQRVTRPDDYLI